MNVAILGAGSWAIALAALVHKLGHNVTMWEISPADAEMLRTQREHTVKLPGIRIPDEVVITTDIAAAINNSAHVVAAVPAQTMRATLRRLAAEADRGTLDRVRCWIIVSKGIECGSLELMSDIVAHEIPGLTIDKIVALSGPSHAEEVSRNMPTTIVAASTNQDLALEVQAAFSTETFRIYTNADIRGVELCASIKNVIALAAGICDGLGFGDNIKGALLTRGMVEMMRLGKELGARESTFSGLAGFGDLVTTCISRHSRNRRMGELIGQGLSLKDALAQMTMVAEGVETAKSVYQLAQKHGIVMPISTEVYKTLFEGKSARLAIRDLMLRQLRAE
jgi:glycerol-3-phosphate dehydrogenase (NAD(P)+)